MFHGAGPCAWIAAISWTSTQFRMQRMQTGSSVNLLYLVWPRWLKSLVKPIGGIGVNRGPGGLSSASAGFRIFAFKRIISVIQITFYPRAPGFSGSDTNYYQLTDMIDGSENTYFATRGRKCHLVTPLCARAEPLFLACVYHTQNYSTLHRKKDKPWLGLSDCSPLGVRIRYVNHD